MQSSTTTHYLPEEFNENFFYNDQQLEKDFFFQSDPLFAEPDDDDDDVDEINENYLRGTINEMKSGFAGLEIKGKVRTLSPVLFYQTNIRYLIMSNNELKYLPPEISNLVNLVYLDLSNNRLKTLPSQIGDLIHLKRLDLESNYLKNLPYELGKLNLEFLGLSNNPLGDHILSLFTRPNGTREVMNYLREKWTIICSYAKLSPYKISSAWDIPDIESNSK